MLAMTAPAGPGARLGGMSEPGRAKSRKGPLCGCGRFLAATPAAADRSDLDTFANAAGGASHQDGPARWRARFLLRQALAPKQVPNRDVADLSTAPGEGGSKSTLGHLWFGRDPLEHSVPDGLHESVATCPE
jgi:hypothetical protein